MSQRKWIEYQAVNQNNWRADVNSSSTNNGELDIELLRFFFTVEEPNRNGIEHDARTTKYRPLRQVEMKYAKCKYCGGFIQSYWDIPNSK